MTGLKRRAMLALCVAFTISGAAQADVLDKVPADAWSVLKVNHLSQTSKRIGAIADKLGLSFMRPELADPLAVLKKEMRITAGMDDDGDVAIVQLDPTGKRQEDAMLVLLPVKDYAALIGGLRGATTEGALTTYKRAGQTLYFTDWGTHAAISANKDLVTAPPSKTLALSPRVKAKGDTGDISLIANAEALAPTLLAQLNEARADAKKAAPEEQAKRVNIDEKYMPAINEGIDRAFGIGETVLNDARQAAVNWSFTENGIGTSFVAEFKPDSYLARTIGTLTPADSSLLTGLSGEGFLFAAGVANSPEVITRLIDDIAGPVLAKLPEGDELSAKVQAFAADGKSLIAQVKTARTVAFNTANQPQSAVVVDVGGDSFLDDLRAFNEKHQPMLRQLQNRATKLDWQQTVAKEARVIDGVKFDRVTVELLGDSESAKFMRDAMTRQRGTDKLEHYIGLVDGKLILFSETTDETIKPVIAAAKSGDESLTKLVGLKSVSDSLPKPRLAELYLTGEPILRAGFGLAATMGQPIRLPDDLDLMFPADLQPIGLVVSRNDASIEADSYVSTDLIQAIITAALQQFGNQGINGGGI